MAGKDAAEHAGWATFKLDAAKAALLAAHDMAAMRLDLPDPFEIGDVAAKLADAYYQGDVTVGPAQIRGIIRWSGRAIFSLRHYGWDFAELCEQLAFPVAEIVGAITPDTRLMASRLHLDSLAILTAAKPAALLVKLAEVIVYANFVQLRRKCRDYRCPYDKSKLHETMETVIQWLPDAHTDDAQAAFQVFVTKLRKVL